jgi:putative ABC transport system permease protein
MRIGGIFQPNALIGSYVVGDRYFLAHFDNPLPVAVLVQTTTGPATHRGDHAGLAAYPNLKIQTRAAVREVTAGAGQPAARPGLRPAGPGGGHRLIGIVNTLMLSVFERTHEIGLLRAVGMKRRQVRAMIRSESVILAVFGAIIGIIVGTALGHRLRRVAEAAGHHRHRHPGGQPGDLLGPLRPARPRRRQLARPPGGQARRADRDRHRLIGAAPRPWITPDA